MKIEHYPMIPVGAHVKIKETIYGRSYEGLVGVVLEHKWHNKCFRFYDVKIENYYNDIANTTVTTIKPFLAEEVIEICCETK